MDEAVLPEKFKELEPFVVWSLPTERARNRKRLASSMAEIQAFYDTILPRGEAIIEYLNQFALEEMPMKEKRLFYLVLSLAEVANAVELFKQPGVIDGFDPERFLPMHE